MIDHQRSAETARRRGLNLGQILLLLVVTQLAAVLLFEWLAGPVLTVPVGG